MDIKQDKVINGLIKIFSKCTTVKQARLFGSRARGDNREKSDYDIAIFGPVSSADKTVIFNEAEELPTLLKIDIAYVDVMDNDAFTQNILKDGIIFYDRA